MKITTQHCLRALSHLTKCSCSSKRSQFICFNAFWSHESLLLGGSRPAAPTAKKCAYLPGRRLSTVALEGNKDHEQAIASAEDESILASNPNSPSHPEGRPASIHSFLSTCKEAEEQMVFDRPKYRKIVRDHLNALGALKFTDVLTKLDCLHISQGSAQSDKPQNTEELLETINGLSVACYVEATTGLGISTNIVLGYIDALQSGLLQLLQGGKEGVKSITLASTLVNCESIDSQDIFDELSRALSLLLLAACEGGLGADILKTSEHLLYGELSEAFLEAATGSCINSLALMSALAIGSEEREAEKRTTALVRALEAMSGKEMTMSPRDLFYCKLWLTCLNAKHRGFLNTLPRFAASFVNNVVMLEHIAETESITGDTATLLYSRLVNDNNQAELDSITLEPFVFSVISYDKKELYTAEVPENYFDASNKSHRREWLKWRSTVAELNGWKTVDVQL